MRWLADVAAIMAALVLIYGGFALMDRIEEWAARRRNHDDHA